MIGCECRVCRSDDPRDQRYRPSIYVTLDDDTRVLVDTTPDLRTQALLHGITRVDAVVFTHAHADHIMGLDDVRRFNAITKRRVFSYAFDPTAPKGGGVPELHLHTIDGPFQIGAAEWRPMPLRHGSWTILGFRIGRFAYLTDCDGVPDATLAELGDLDVLVLDALRHKPHPTHFTLAQALDMAARIGAKRTFFTHIAHDLGHEETSATLPPAMALAYDGLTLDVA
jgi:phosphoribosyl 1,2-cyclic phosphate phosphodiesterase